MSQEKRLERLNLLGTEILIMNQESEAIRGNIVLTTFKAYGAFSICHRIEENILALKFQVRNGLVSDLRGTLMQICLATLLGLRELTATTSVPCQLEDSLRNHIATYSEKNTKYGNSFSQTVKEYGLMVLCIRLDDKLNRAKQLLLRGEEGTLDESFMDTLLDLSLYTLMGVMELEEAGETPVFMGEVVPVPEVPKSLDGADIPKEPEPTHVTTPVGPQPKNKSKAKDKEYWEKEFVDYTKDELFEIAEILKVETPPRKKITKPDLITLLLAQNLKKLEAAVNEQDSRS